MFTNTQPHNHNIPEKNLGIIHKNVPESFCGISISPNQISKQTSSVNQVSFLLLSITLYFTNQYLLGCVFSKKSFWNFFTDHSRIFFWNRMISIWLQSNIHQYFQDGTNMKNNRNWRW